MMRMRMAIMNIPAMELAVRTIVVFVSASGDKIICELENPSVIPVLLYLNLSRLIYCRQTGVPSSCTENRSTPCDLFCCQANTHSSRHLRPDLKNCLVAAFCHSSKPNFQISTGCSLSKSSCPPLLGLLLQSR